MLPVSFWRRFAAIENAIAIKVAPFNRYRTLDVVRFPDFAALIRATN
jgi:hypothetical protein